MQLRPTLIVQSSFLFLCSIFLLYTYTSAITDSEIASYQREIADKPIGERIALWAERFVGTPYDPDPIGEYVRKEVLINDERVDCMYLSFRALELALSHTPEEAIKVALDKRFETKGILKEGHVQNYDKRFQYGEDMLDSNKWGRDITSKLGQVSYIEGSRGRKKVAIISKEEMLRLLEKRKISLKDGDFIYFVKYPEKRIMAEIVGHIGIIKREGDEVFLIHANGSKNKGGSVKKVLLIEYIKSMPFAGIRVGRFTDP